MKKIKHIKKIISAIFIGLAVICSNCGYAGILYTDADGSKYVRISEAEGISTVTVEIARELQMVLKTEPSITKVYLCGVSLGIGTESESPMIVMSTLRDAPGLTTLSLDLTPVYDQGAEVLAGYLGKNTTLKVLGLSHCFIKNTGTSAIANALKLNTSLIQLYLDGNFMGVESAKSIAEALGVNRTLKLLTLKSNSLTPEGLQNILGALVFNLALQNIEADWGREQAEIAALILRRNQLVSSLSVVTAYDVLMCSTRDSLLQFYAVAELGVINEIRSLQIQILDGMKIKPKTKIERLDL